MNWKRVTAVITDEESPASNDPMMDVGLHLGSDEYEILRICNTLMYLKYYVH